MEDKKEYLGQEGLKQTLEAVKKEIDKVDTDTISNDEITQIFTGESFTDTYVSYKEISNKLETEY